MPLYLASSYLPEDFDPSPRPKRCPRNRRAERGDGCCRYQDFRRRKTLFRGAEAKSLRPQLNGKVVVTDGPYMETKEHIGGFIILKAANLEEALAWGRKFALACRATIEVRPFLPRTEEDNQQIPGIGQS